ncbi:MAG: purine-nucleoside phosphorylase [bacterium]
MREKPFFQKGFFPTVLQAADFVRDCTSHHPRVGFILGSGFGVVADALEKVATFPNFSLRGFPRPSVKGHAGDLVIGELEGKAVAMFAGRVHPYEGVEIEETLLTVRLLKELGVKTLIVTNSAGGISHEFCAGDLMAITDHINLTFRRLKTEPGDERRVKGCVYDERLIREFVETGKSLGISVGKGVYCAFCGPTYETRAEVRMMREFGADAVGMSTVFEAREARRLGMRVLGVSSISNSHVHTAHGGLTHDDVLAATTRAAEGALKIFRELTKKDVL